MRPFSQQLPIQLHIWLHCSEAQRRRIEKEAEKKSKIASPVRRKGRTPKLRSLLLPAHPLKSNDLLLLGS
jgi:hypothetical protein